MEKQELRVELALRAKAEASRAAANAAASADALSGIGRFETTLRQMGKDAPPGELQLTKLPELGATPLEQIQRIRSMLPDAAVQERAGAAYLATVKGKKADDAFARRERERRRRKAVLEQQRAQDGLESKAAEESLLGALQRQSAQEALLAGRLWQLRQEKEVMREARTLREQQYAERRAKDLEEALARERELSAAMAEEYALSVSAEMERWEAADAERKGREVQEVRELIGAALWGMVGLAERVCAYREAADAMVPRKEYREWVALYVGGQAEELGAPLVKGAEGAAEGWAALASLSLYI